jgi:hypothetical protein
METTNKNHVVLLHGLAGSPNYIWLPWLRAELEKAGAEVWAPSLPSPLAPKLDVWLDATRDAAATWGPDTVIVGHSLGGVLALRLIEHVCPRPIRGVVLVSSPFSSIARFDWLVTFFDEPIDWAKLRSMASSFTVLNARNDIVVPFDHSLRYSEQLGARLVLEEKGSHFVGRKAPVVLAEAERMMGRSKSG